MAKIQKLYRQDQLIYPATITNAVKDPETGKTIPEILKEREEDTYPKMTVGFAENIVGDGSATSEEFSFRPTAGVNRNTLNDGAARIQTLKGSSVVANQLIKAQTNIFTDNGVTFTPNSDGTIRATGIPTAAAHYGLNAIQYHSNEVFFVRGSADGGDEYPYGNMIFDQGRQIEQGNGAIWTPQSYWSTAGIVPVLRIGTNYIGQEVDFIFKPEIISLTQEFGAGNEPLTVEEYYQRKPIVINEDEYNEGTLVNLVPKAIKTTGFNQWDEQWEVGGFITSTGKPNTNSDQIRSKNLIPVLSGQKYYAKTPASIWCFFYDKNKKLVQTNIGATQSGYACLLYNTNFIVPLDVHYIKFYVVNTYGATYKNDICISLYWPTEYGNLYGTYKPYKPFERDLSWVSKYFPNGMRSAGSAHDEIRFNSTEQRWEAIQKVGVVDLGRLSWTGKQNLYYVADVPTIAQAINRLDGLMCSRYPVSTYTGVNENAIDKTILRYEKQIIIKDTSYQNPTEFKASLQGVMLNYELAEPIVTPITENINFDYDVSDYGTEELIVAEGVESAPLSASIEYSPNVLAMLKNAPDIANDVDALKSQVAALTAQLAALTATNNE